MMKRGGGGWDLCCPWVPTDAEGGAERAERAARGRGERPASERLSNTVMTTTHRALLVFFF
jgi:hypothetical protein